MHRTLFLLPIVCAAIALLSAPCFAQPNEIMSLWESPDERDPADPWPAGLRVVIYDTGQVLKLVRSHADDVPSQIVTGIVSPDGAKHRAASAFAQLSGVPLSQSVVVDF